MSEQNNMIGVKVDFNGNIYKTEWGKLYARMFGTTMYNHNMHWSWGEIDKSSKLGKEVMEYIRGVK